ncbi:MAG: Type 1 glutamine amidotransferase-like domain-containing protein [Chloroflexi bacterium]|nr:Type 1 glutamine amidotransferase-like domain-containing protein [Chloroflexota bacterium]
MPGMIALVGGDEFRDGTQDMDRAILEAAGVERPALLVLPTAAAFERPELAAANGVTHFARLGAEAAPLMVENSSHANDAELLAPVDHANVIYFTGGNPAHLLDALTGSALLEKLKGCLERGAVVAGSSAGAMVMGSWMRFRGEWSQALGIAPGIAVLPHHERARPGDVARELAQTAPRGITCLGIDGRAACFGSPVGGWRALGAGNVTVYRDGNWRRYKPGETVDI